MQSFQEFMKPEILWFVIGVLLLISEFFIPGLIIGFFGAGAIVTAFFSFFFNISVSVQLAIFIVASLISLFSLRKYLKSALDKGDGSTGYDDFIGENAKVVESINNIGGKVHAHGTTWKAIADEKINEGETVKIINKENITLKVEKLTK